MLARSTTLLALATIAATLLGSPAQAAEPDREDLQQMLLTPEDLAAVTHGSWTAQPTLQPGEPGSTGCALLDSAVLAANTGLLDSGTRPYVSTGGDILQESVAYDTRAQQDVAQLATAIQSCPVMTFADAPTRVPIRSLSLGDTVAGFRTYIGGTSRSVVLAAAYGDYVIEIVASDHGNTEAYYQQLLEAAYHRIDNPS